MGINLTPAEMLEVFGEHDPTEHVEEAKQRWGDTDGYREAHRRTSSYGKEEWLQIRREGDEIPAQFAAAMQAGHPADSPAAAAAAVAHREHISRWFYDVTPEVHQGWRRCTSPTQVHGDVRRRGARSRAVRRATRSWRCTARGRRRGAFRSGRSGARPAENWRHSTKG